jgi:hypothetical protein
VTPPWDSRGGDRRLRVRDPSESVSPWRGCRRRGVAAAAEAGTLVLVTAVARPGRGLGLGVRYGHCRGSGRVGRPTAVTAYVNPVEVWVLQRSRHR